MSLTANSDILVKKEHHFFSRKKKDCSIYKYTQLSFEKNVYFLADETKKDSLFGKIISHLYFAEVTTIFYRKTSSLFCSIKIYKWE